jgi:hypothetical protein
VELQGFGDRTASDLRFAIDSLAGAGMQALVLDLRDNPGGLLEEGIDVAELLLHWGEVIAETRGRRGIVESRRVSESADITGGMPIAVLVGPASASAAEIVAGALQDNGRAVVIGERTHGKGSVQSFLPMSGGYWFRVTTARWHTPSGRSIQRLGPDDAPGDGMGLGGIVPDFEVGDPMEEAGMRIVRSLGPAREHLGAALSAAVRTKALLEAEPTDAAIMAVLVEELTRRSGQDGIGQSLGEDARWLALEVRSEIALRRRGDLGYRIVRNDSDPVVAAAVRVLSDRLKD